MKHTLKIALFSLALGASAWAAVPDVWAAGQQGAQTVQVQQKQEKKQGGEKRMGPPRRKPMSEAQMVTILTEKYFLTPETAKAYLAQYKNFQELESFVKYAGISGKTVEEIAALKHDEPWERVVYLIGATPQKIYDWQISMDAKRLHRWWGIDEKMALSYLHEGYPMHYIKVAYVLSKHSDWTVDRILKDKKYPENWKAWCQRNLGISPETYDAWINEYKNPTYFPGQYF